MVDRQKAQELLRRKRQAGASRAQARDEVARELGCDVVDLTFVDVGWESESGTTAWTGSSSVVVDHQPPATSSYSYDSSSSGSSSSSSDSGSSSSSSSSSD